MGRQGGQGKGKPKLKDRDFGKSLISNLKSAKQGVGGKGAFNPMSVLEQDHLDEFITATEMEAEDVVTVRVHDDHAYLVEPTRRVFQSMNIDQFDFEHIKIPRKPKWDSSMSREEVDRNEKDIFLTWRRDIAAMEELHPDHKTTPYEKNIDVWRQLWRVLEKSDMAVQIVDARNPLLFYTRDLVNYGCEIEPERPKLTMLLVNKADFLTEHQRQQWARYFNKNGIPFAFYSAKIEQDKLDNKYNDSDDEDEEEEDEEDDEVENEDDDVIWEDDNEDDDDEEEEAPKKKEKKSRGKKVSEENLEILARDIVETWLHKILEPIQAKAAGQQDSSNSSSGSKSSSSNSNSSSNKPISKVSAYIEAEKERQRTKILTRLELIDLIELIARILHIEPNERHDGRSCVALLGYPNVGKSSCINTILGVSKSTHGVARVAISSTPGKTKHFQTLILNEQIMLCDCPGLVFPSFMNSTGEMLCAGILPINQMRNCQDPADVIASRIPIYLLDAAYGMKIHRILDVKDDPNRPPTGIEMLAAYCKLKGYITGQSGRWDEFRGCKDLLRDFNDGKLLFVSPPSGVNVDMVRWISDVENIMARKERVAERLAVQRLKDLENQVDDLDIDSEEEKDMKAKSKLAASSSSLLDGYEEGEMVFGSNSYKASQKSKDAAGGGSGGLSVPDSEGFTYYDDESDDDQVGELEAAFDAAASESKGGKGGKGGSGVGGSSKPKGVVSSSASIASESTNPNREPKREHKRLKHWGKKNKKNQDKDPYSEFNGVVSYVAYTTNRAKVGGEQWQQVKLQGSSKMTGSLYTRQTLPYQDPVLKETLLGSSKEQKAVAKADDSKP